LVILRFTRFSERQTDRQISRANTGKIRHFTESKHLKWLPKILMDV